MSASLRRGVGFALALAVTGLVTLVFASWNSTASASPYPPSAGCTVSTTSTDIGPGSSVTFVGSGFAANKTVSLSVPSASAALGSVITNSSGSFSGTFTWPASVAGKSAVVQASAPSTTCKFTMVNSKEATNLHHGKSTGASGSGLSSTGFAAGAATLIALVLLGSGAIFLGLARRKRV